MRLHRLIDGFSDLIGEEVKLSNSVGGISNLIAGYFATFIILNKLLLAILSMNR